MTVRLTHLRLRSAHMTLRQVLNALRRANTAAGLLSIELRPPYFSLRLLTTGLLALPLECKALDAFEKLAVGSESRAHIRLHRQRRIHHAVVVRVEQLVTDTARGAQRRERTVNRVVFRSQGSGPPQTGYRQVRFVRGI